MSVLKKAGQFLNRNRILISGEPCRKNRVNLEYWAKVVNIGDTLGPVVYQYMLERKNISPDQPVGRTCHLLTIGSILGISKANSVVWGSGLHLLRNANAVRKNRLWTKLDIRAVRGPVTKALLGNAGFPCSSVPVGDPAVLMPLICQPDTTEKKYPVSLISHFRCGDSDKTADRFHKISVQTDDFRFFINELAASELVVSSSLHGIILAESFGVPAVFLNPDHKMDEQLMKYYDWYYSTGRDNVVIAHSPEEALSLTPMPLPELDGIREGLLASFPYDLWA